MSWIRNARDAQAGGAADTCLRTRQTPGRRTERSRLTDTKSPGGRTGGLRVAVREGSGFGNEVAEVIHASATSEYKSWPRTLPGGAADLGPQAGHAAGLPGRDPAPAGRRADVRVDGQRAHCDHRAGGRGAGATSGAGGGGAALRAGGPDL